MDLSLPTHARGHRTSRLLSASVNVAALSIATILVLALQPGTVLAQVPATVAAPAARADFSEANRALARERSVFIENKGQWDSEARFLVQTSGLDTWITAHGVVYDLHVVKREPANEPLARAGDESVYAAPAVSGVGSGISERGVSQAGPETQPTATRRGHVVRMQFAGTNMRTRSVGTDPQAGTHNYFLGNDQAKWATGVKRYGGVRVENLYEGIDAVYYLEQGRPRYDLVVAPGADPASVRMTFEGATSVRVAHDGALEIATSMGPIRQQELFAYQEIGGVKHQVRCAFVAHSDEVVAFDVGEYDRSRELVVDPLVWSTFVGGSGDDRIDQGDVAVDASGNVYVAGYSYSTNYPTTSGVYDESQNRDWDAFVTKLSSAGSSLSYSTYIGGAYYDLAYGITVDGSGNAYVAGYTLSTNFPTTGGAYDESHNGSDDAFVTKLSADGSSLSYSTYIGGESGDYASDITLDGSGNVYITGYTQSMNYPTTSGTYDESHNGSYDIFVTKLSADESTLIYSTFIGGTNWDIALGIALGGSGNAYVTGYTGSASYPRTSRAYDESNNGGADVVVTKLSADGSSLSFSTYLGGMSTDYAFGLTLDGSGNAYVTGLTTSSNFPTTSGAYDESYNGSYDVFVTKLSADGSSLSYSTYLGGEKHDAAYGITLDGSGNAYVTGFTANTNFPTAGTAYDESHNGSDDVFVTKLSADGTALPYSTYIGGTSADYALGIALDGSGNAYLAGHTRSADFPTTSGAYDESHNGEYDVFVTKLSLGGTVSLTSPNSSESWCAGSSQSITWTSSGVTNVKLELSSDGGATWPTTITASTGASGGSYSWSIPSTQAYGTSYRLRVSDAADATVSDASDASFAITTPPTITQQPLSNDPVCPGTSVTFTVAVAGTPAPSVQWQTSSDGVSFDDLSGETSTSLTIAAPTLSMHGIFYRARLTNVCSMVNSLPAMLSVVDATAPVPDLATLPVISGECSATIATAPTATDVCVGAITGTTTDPLSYNDQGEYVVTWTYGDGHGNTSTQIQTVVVRDQTPPTISVTMDPTSLWPANHDMRAIAASVTTNDNCPGSSYVLTNISSSESDNGLGDGDLTNDIQDASLGTVDEAFSLRAERSGIGNGRVYTITYTVTDVGGNSVEGVATVSVPRSQAKPVVGEAHLVLEHLGFASRSIPNPLMSQTQIEYHLAVGAHTIVKVHDALGAVIAVLVDAHQDAGQQSVLWSAVDASGMPLPAGTYFYTIESDGTRESGSMVLVR